MTGYEELRSRTAVIDLSTRGKIRVTGEDRARLLHAMSTNHINGLKENQGAYAFFLTAQGRIIADACIYHLGDSFLLDTEPELATKLLEHLDRFIIADDAEVKDETDQWAAIGLEGPESLKVASQLAIPVPETLFSVSSWRNGFAVRAASTGPEGIRIFVPVPEAQALPEMFLAAGIPYASVQDAQIVRLENGVPRYGEDISERYLAQETGVLHAVHPNKGCYVGQEIVERVRSQAHVHRHLTPLRIDSSEAPAPGTKLILNGKEAGEITSAAFSPGLGEVVALGYVRTEGMTGGLQLTLASGARARAA